MTRRRILLLVLIAIQTVAFAHVSTARVLPTIVIVLAVLGVTGRFSFTLSRSREVIVSLGIVLCFLLAQRYAPFPLWRRAAALLRPYDELLCVSFICLQVLHLFLRRPEGPRMIVLLYGFVAMTMAGNQFISYSQQYLGVIYEGLAVGFVVIAALFAGTAVRRAPTHARRRTRYVLTAATLAVALVGGALSAHTLKAYERELTSLSVRLLLRDVTGADAETGYSGSGELNSISRRRSAQENRIVLRIEADEEPGYLRGAAFAWYGRWGWHNNFEPSLLPRTEMPRSGGRREFVLRAAPPGEALRKLTVWAAPSFKYAVFAPLGTTSLTAHANDLTIDPLDKLGSGSRNPDAPYGVTSPATPPQEPLDASLRAMLTRAPHHLDPRVEAIARDVFRDCDTTPAKIDAVVRYFHANYHYGLGIRPPFNRDPLIYFLIEQPAAHCEFFAAGAAVLLRLAGVPTRYVTGFVAAEHNTAGGYWIARNRDAHAWVEAYDDDGGRWVLVEATPPGGVPELRSSGASDLWETLRFRVRELIVRIRTEGLGGLRDWLVDRAEGSWRSLVSGSTVSIAVILAVLAPIVWYCLRRWRRRSRRAVITDPRLLRLHALLARADRLAAPLAPPRLPGETLHHYAARLNADASSTAGAALAPRLVAWYVAYANARYGRRDGDEVIEELEGELEALG